MFGAYPCSHFILHFDHRFYLAPKFLPSPSNGERPRISLEERHLRLSVALDGVRRRPSRTSRDRARLLVLARSPTDASVLPHVLRITPEGPLRARPG